MSNLSWKKKKSDLVTLGRLSYTAAVVWGCWDCDPPGALYSPCSRRLCSNFLYLNAFELLES